MNPEFAAFLSNNGTAVVVVLGLLAAVGLVQWRKIRVAEAEQEFKQALLDKGAAPADIERAAAAKAPGRRGLLEQFGALSGGGKAGVIVGTVVVTSIVFGCVSGVIHSV